MWEPLTTADVKQWQEDLTLLEVFKQYYFDYYQYKGLGFVGKEELGRAENYLWKHILSSKKSM